METQKIGGIQMKKSLLTAIILTVGLSFTLLTDPYPVEGATKEVTYKNCKELNKDYKYGVSKAKGTKNKIVNRKTKEETFKSSNAYVSVSLYKLNEKMDNDNDGIACEK